MKMLKVTNVATGKPIFINPYEVLNIQDSGSPLAVDYSAYENYKKTKAVIYLINNWSYYVEETALEVSEQWSRLVN